jgi:hypothetical protein
MHPFPCTLKDAQDREGASDGDVLNKASEKLVQTEAGSSSIRTGSILERNYDG